jgi:hypothetical protein
MSYRYQVTDNKGRYDLAGCGRYGDGVPCGRQVMASSAMGFSLKPPKWLRKAGTAVAKVALPIAAVGGALLLPGVGSGIVAAASGLFGRKVGVPASTVIPAAPQAAGASGVVASTIKAAATLFPASSPSVPTPVSFTPMVEPMSPGLAPRIAASAGSSAGSPTGGATPDWLMPAVIGGAALLLFAGMKKGRA